MKKSVSRYFILNTMIILMIGAGLKGQVTNDSDNPRYANAMAPEDEFRSLVWSDEFEIDGAIDTTKWFHQTKLPTGTSWYNNEIQHYTNRADNSYNDTGYLHIVAKKEEFTDQGVTKQYTSARLNSKIAFTYGKVEIRAKLPFGVGTWPAMWTLGKNVRENGGYWYTQGFGTTGWPECGEIDIMEHWGSNQDYVSSAMHTPSSYGGTVNKDGRTVAGASTEFHVFTCEWTPEKMDFSIDDIVHYTYNPAVKDADTWPFDKEQYLLLNVAILPNITGDFTESPLIIDYVRIYEYIPAAVQLTNSKKPVYYPNPFTDEITIDLGEVPDQDMYIKIYDSKGSTVKTYKIPDSGDRFTLKNLDNLVSGLYLVSCESDTKFYSYRMAKE